MLDLKFIKDNPALVADAAKNKGIKLDIEELLAVAAKRGELLQEIELLRTQVKPSAKPTGAALTKVKQASDQLAKLTGEMKEIEPQFTALMLSVPNLYSDDTPIGPDENANKELRKVGKPPKFDFKPRDHQELAGPLLDFTRGAKVAGSKFYFLTGALAELESALTRYASEILLGHGFTMVAPPLLAKREIIEGKGLLGEADIKQNLYRVEDEDLYLIGTGEIPLTGLHADEIIPGQELPLKYFAMTPCFRRESGTYGQHSKGLFRVHQFNKVEMYQYVTPEASDAALEEMLAIEESIVAGLGIAYRVVAAASGDMASYLFKQYDLEYYSPADGGYRELMSAGNARDFQSRRLSIRGRAKDGQKFLVHTLNATVTATSRMMIAILENYQTDSGEVTVPDVLRPYFTREKIISKE